MSLFDSIFGVVGGPIALGIGEAEGGQAAADTRGAFIAAQGGLGATAIEAGAGDDPQAINTGVTADVALGGAAATVATLGAGAPAAAAGTSAVAGSEIAGSTAAEGAGAGAAAAGTSAAEGAGTAAASAAPEIATAPTVAGAGASVGQSAGTAAGTAASDVGTQTPIAAGQTAIDQSSGVSTAAQTGQTLKDASKVGMQAYGNINKVYQASQTPETAEMPTVSGPGSGTMSGGGTGELQTNNPQMQSAGIAPKASQFDAIFGTPSVGGVPNLLGTQSPSNPNNPLTNDQLGGLLKPPPLLQPPPLVQPPQMEMSDRTNKTNINNADRSIANFLSQIYGRI